MSPPEFTGWGYDELSGLSSVKVGIYDYNTDMSWDGTDWVDDWVLLDAVLDEYGDWYYDISSVTLVSGNEYEYYAEAYDAAGNTNYDYYDFVYRETDYIYLAPGWNFISIPRNVTAEHDTWGEVFAGMEWGSEYITEAWGYNAFAATPWFQLKANTPVEALTGYWLYFDYEQLDYGERASLTMAPAVEGLTDSCYEALALRIHYDNSGKTVPASKVLKGNAWNAIGPSGWYAYYPHPVTSELASLKDSWSTLIAWSPIIQEYWRTILYPGYIEEEYWDDYWGEYYTERYDLHMIPGMGYWIWISAAEGDTLSSIASLWVMDGEYGWDGGGYR